VTCCCGVFCVRVYCFFFLFWSMETYTHAGNYNNYLDGCMNEQGREGAGAGPGRPSWSQSSSRPSGAWSSAAATKGQPNVTSQLTLITRRRRQWRWRQRRWQPNSCSSWRASSSMSLSAHPVGGNLCRQLIAPPSPPPPPQDAVSYAGIL